MEVDPGGAGQIDAKSGHNKVVDARAAVVPDVELLQRRPVRDQDLALRPDAVTEVEILLADVDVIDEAGFGDEARAVVEIERLQVELAAGALQIGLVARTGGMGAIGVQRAAAYGLSLQAPVLIELEVGVDAADAVVPAPEFTVGKNGADGGLVENVVAYAGDRKRSSLPAVRVTGGQGLAWGAVVGGQHADRPGTGLPRQPQAKFRVTDAAGEDQVDGGGEEVAVLEEKRALLREKDLEALVDRDLGLVAFHLAEVGVHGGLKNEAAMEDELSVDANIGLERAAFEEGVVGVALIDVAKAADQPVRNELHVARRGNVFQAGQGRGLVESPLDAVGDARPEDVFVGARNAAVQDDPPLLDVGVGEAQAFEWDRDQHNVAAPGQAPLGTPHRVERRVEAAIVAGGPAAHRAFGPQRIPLDAQWVGGEGVAAARVVERVEHDLDGIIGENVFAPRHAGADLVGVAVPGDEGRVEVVLVVGEVDVGLLRGLRAIGRFAHHETGDFEHMVGDPAAGLHVLEIRERRRRVDARDADGGRRCQQRSGPEPQRAHNPVHPASVPGLTRLVQLMPAWCVRHPRDPSPNFAPGPLP